MRPPKRNRKPPAKNATAAKVPRNSKRRNSTSTVSVEPGPSSSGQFQSEGDLAIPGPSRLLQSHSGSSSGQIRTSFIDSAMPDISGLTPQTLTTSSLSQPGQPHSQENQTRAIASTSTGRNLQDTTSLLQAAPSSYHERHEGSGPRQITTHGSVTQNNNGTYQYPTIPSLSNSLIREYCSSDASPIVNNSPVAIASVYDPISSHIPIKMKEKAWRGEFMDLDLLLKSARELAIDNNVQGDITLRGNSLTVVNKSTQPIKNIHVWSSAFMIYASLMLEKFPNKGLEFFKYMHTVRMAASRGYSLGWVNYDEQYRLRKAASPSSSWGVVDMELWMLCVSTPPSGNIGFGNVDRQFRNSTPIANTSHNVNLGSALNFQRRGDTNNSVCRLFNRGLQCKFGKNCKYLHKCAKCNGNHPIANCRLNM